MTDWEKGILKHIQDNQLCEYGANENVVDLIKQEIKKAVDESIEFDGYEYNSNKKNVFKSRGIE